MIRARARGVPVRLYTEPQQYRDPSRYWHAWNVDRLYMAGVQIRHRAHAGSNHQKSVTLKGQLLTIFGSSNWTSPSSDSQEEYNYFTRKSWMHQWFIDQFQRKWNNLTGHTETKPFVPLPPDEPQYLGPSNLTTAMPTSGVTLKWLGLLGAQVRHIFRDRPDAAARARRCDAWTEHQRTPRKTVRPAAPSRWHDVLRRKNAAPHRRLQLSWLSGQHADSADRRVHGRDLCQTDAA